MLGYKNLLSGLVIDVSFSFATYLPHHSRDYPHFD